MEWKDEYATGDSQIDEQHRTIFRMAEDFRSALDEGGGKKIYGTFLNFLDDYCIGHFHYEEKCMFEHKCPVAQGNKNAHARFLEMLRAFRVRYTATGFRPSDARELVDSIDNWLDSHICKIDVHLKACITKP